MEDISKIWDSLSVMSDTSHYITPRLVTGTYIYRFNPIHFKEPVSALPLAIVIVLVGFLLIGGIATIWDYFYPSTIEN